MATTTKSKPAADAPAHWQLPPLPATIDQFPAWRAGLEQERKHAVQTVQLERTEYPPDTVLIDVCEKKIRTIDDGLAFGERLRPRLELEDARRRLPELEEALAASKQRRAGTERAFSAAQARFIAAQQQAGLAVHAQERAEAELQSLRQQIARLEAAVAPQRLTYERPGVLTPESIETIFAGARRCATREGGGGALFTLGQTRLVGVSFEDMEQLERHMLHVGRNGIWTRAAQLPLETEAEVFTRRLGG
jgi:hypothetical protein